MVENTVLIENFTKLIESSPNLTDTEKAAIIKNIPNLSLPEISKGIETFEWEKQELKNVMLKLDADSKIIESFLKEKDLEYRQFSTTAIKELEDQDQKSSSQNADDLLNSI